MTKALAIRPKEKHPLHVLQEFEVWPVEERASSPSVIRERVLAGLPKMARMEVSWSVVSLRSDSALQEIFHTEDRLCLADVPKLCCGLPGVGGCVLARRHEELAAWNLPMDLDSAKLLEMASAALDRTLDARSAGWGDLQGITLHLEVGSASLLRQGVMQMLVFHEKRGFAPGVREKLTLALGVVSRTLRAIP